MKYFNLTLFVLICLTPATAMANWYWVSVVSEPNTGYFIEETSPNTIGYTTTDTTDPHSNRTPVPINFMDTMEETKASDTCSGELNSAIQTLRQFDADEEITYPIKCHGECSPYYTYSVETVAAREQLLADIESDAQSCMINEQKEIREAIEEQKQKEAAEAREVAIVEAVEACDLDFFDTMTTPEKMDTFREREACKVEATTSEVTEDIVETAVANPTPVLPTPVQPSASPVITAPVIVSTPEPVTETETIIESDIEASSTPDTIEPETEPQVASELEEPVDATEPATPPSFFQRVINFFTSWF